MTSSEVAREQTRAAECTGQRGARSATAARRRLAGSSLARKAAVLALLTALTALAGAASASAIIVHSHGSSFGVQPLPGAAGARPFATPQSARTPRNGVKYSGGPVMSSNTNYTFYWDPAGAPKYAAEYETGINRYFEDLADDSGGLENTDSVLEQYSGEAGTFSDYESHFGGELIDTTPYPTKNNCTAAPICLTDEQLQKELRSYVQANGLPMDLQHEYFILTPPKVESCFEEEGFICSVGTESPAYCAYHGFVEVGSKVIVYANDPYVAGTQCDTEEHPNENESDATIGGGLSHEHAESVTDPELNAWFSRSGEEVGDLCRTFEPKTEFGTVLGHAPDGSRYNQVIAGDRYWYQQEWSNEANACVQRAPQAPTVLKLSPKNGPKTGGTAVTITGGAFLGKDVTVYFNGVPASGVVVNSPSSVTATAPPSSVTGVVDVTVKTLETSALTRKDHYRYKR